MKIAALGVLFCFGLLGAPRADAAPLKLDPKRIINESSGFLKDREPEMTAEEFPIYEKVSALLATQPDFAITLLEGMLSEKTPPSPAFELVLGNAYYSVGQRDKAEAHYLSAVKRYPSFIRAWDNLGILYYSMDRYGEAIPCLSKAVALGARDPGTLGLLGFCLERTGKPVAAEMSYMQALSGDPDNTDWMTGLLRIYTQGRQFGPAESLVKNLIKARPAEAGYWLAYADILLADNRKLEAIVMLEASSGAGVAGIEELSLLADLYAGQGLVPEAIGAFQKTIALNPDLGERKLIRFAQVLVSAGRLQQAEQVLAGLPEALTPAGRLALLQARADIFAARKQWPEARRELAALLQASPLDGRAMMGMGDAYLAEGDLVRAELSYGAAYRIPESAYRASFELANIELRNRHYDRCAEYLQKALSIEKTDAMQDFLDRVKAMIVK
jgi:tetratricopeptide (TPR) repeat protein